MSKLFSQLGISSPFGPSKAVVAEEAKVAAQEQKVATKHSDDPVDCPWKAFQLGNQMGRWKNNKAGIAYAYEHNLKGIEVKTWWPGNAEGGECQDVREKSRKCWYTSRLLNDVACTEDKHCLHFAAHDGEATHTYTCPTWVRDPEGRRCKLPDRWQACPDKFHLKRTDTGVPQNFQMAMSQMCGLDINAKKLLGRWILTLDKSKWEIDVNNLGQLQFHGLRKQNRVHCVLKKDPEGWWVGEMLGDNDLPVEPRKLIRVKLDPRGEVQSSLRKVSEDKWTDSINSYKEIFTYGGDANGDRCVFPFVHNGVEYWQCTTVDDAAGLPWCMTDSPMINTPKALWGYCKAQVPPPDKFMTPTHGGTAQGASCMLPFTYKKKEVKECTSEGEASPWCMTDENGNWGYCNCRVPEPGEGPIKTHGGSAKDGSQCKFPFVYRSEEMKTCITEGEDAPWCMTDDKGNWGYCDCKKPLDILRVPKTPKPEDIPAAQEAAPEEEEKVHTDHCRGDTSTYKVINMIFNVRDNSWYRCAPNFICEPWDIRAIEENKDFHCGDKLTCKKGEFCFVHRVDSKTSTFECVPDLQVWLVSSGDDVAKFQVPALAASFKPPRFPSRAAGRRPGCQRRGPSSGAPGHAPPRRRQASRLGCFL